MMAKVFQYRTRSETSLLLVSYTKRRKTNMLKDKVAETLVEMLQHYVDEVQEEEDRSNFSDDYIVDKLLQVKENFHKDGVEEGRAYETHILITDKPVKIYDTVELRRMF